MEQQNTTRLAPGSPHVPDTCSIFDMDTEEIVIPDALDDEENKENIPPTSSVMTRKKEGLTLNIPSKERLMEMAFEVKTVPATPTVEKKNPFHFITVESFYGTPDNRRNLAKAPKKPKRTYKRRLNLDEDSNKKKSFPPPPPPPSSPMPSPPQGLTDKEYLKYYTNMIDNTEAHMSHRLMAITFTAIQQAVKNDPNGALFQLGNVRDNVSFVKTVYDLSTQQNDFWIKMKSLTLGSSNGIRMAITSEYKTREAMCPAQFSSFRPTTGNFVPEMFQRIGNYGENWVASQLDIDEMVWAKPGKICDLTFPIMSATPDYLLFSKEDDASGVEGMPIDFGGRSVIGFEECKSSYMKPIYTTPKWSDDKYTVEDILFDRKYKPTSISKIMLAHDARRVRKPNWPNLTNHVHDTIMSSMKETIKWRSVYTDNDSQRCVRCFNPEVKDNQVGIRLFTTDIGRQLLMESMMILDYIRGDNILVRMDMPSVVNNNELSQCEQYVDRAERRRFRDGYYVLPETMDADLESTNFMDNPDIARALDLDTPSDEEVMIPDRFEVKYSMVAEFSLPVASLKELRDVVIRPSIVTSIAEVAESNFFIKTPAVNPFDRKPLRRTTKIQSN